MTINDLFIFFLLPLSLGVIAFTVAILARMRRSKQKLDPEHYLLFIFSIILFIAVNYALLSLY